ncbi:chemosensory receptor a [Plakobranchus ocellatus]|uniref:Chemosensory receptor a n=1 Tax=Plakobranchus ocellatus TaxID=259542 RepID=A0AAV4CZU5_9GAST|nr:chemosensory receptor a [Plakobranchus ocellatus]
MENTSFSNLTSEEANNTKNCEKTISVFFQDGRQQFISQEAYDTFFLVTIIINEGMSVLGVATNIINIIVFVKLGLRESTSISLLSLAVSDLLLTLLALWSNILYIPQFSSFNTPLRADEMFFVTGGVARMFVSRTGALITTYIALERCLCVIAPLKVKAIVTRRRTCTAMVTIFIITIGPSLFLYNNYHIAYYYYPDVNRTLLGASYIDTEVNYILDRVVTAVCGTAFLIFSFATTSVCTIYLVIYLQRSTKWRLTHSKTHDKTNEALSNNNDTNVTVATVKDRRKKEVESKKKSLTSTQRTSKDDRVVRTVVVITMLFIVCFFPGCVAFALYVALPGFTLYGRYGQLFVLVYTVCFIIEPINSCFNLFIYYSMGTHFRTMLHQVFRLKMPK